MNLAKQPTLDFSTITKATELKSRVWFTLVALVVFRVGAYIPLPGIDPHALANILAKKTGGILDMFNMLSGGSLGRMTIFALAIMPYITASIILQLMTVVSKSLESLKKEGEAGRRKINQYTRYATVFLAGMQAFGVAVGLEGMNAAGSEIVIHAGFFFRLTTVVTLVTGTVFLMWLGEQITNRGVGNGISLIIFSGIVAGLPSALARTFELGRSGALSPVFIVLLMVMVGALIAVIVFMERAQRRILVQYPKRQVGNKIYGGEATHIPLKLNTAGVIPPIFASSILLFPLTIASFSAGKGPEWLQTVSVYLGHGKPLYIVFYVLLIVFFSFFYTAVVFNPVETADNLKKNGGFILGKRPGKATAEYLDYILSRITVLGAGYIALVCVLPEILISRYAVPFYLGGTSILIVVNVVMDTIMQIQTHLFAHQYEDLIKRAKLRGKK